MKTALKIIKSIFFYPLLWFRNFIIVPLKIIAGISSFAFVAYFLMIVFNNKTFIDAIKLCWPFALVSFICFLLSHFYIRLLIALQPDGENITFIER